MQVYHARRKEGFDLRHWTHRSALESDIEVMLNPGSEGVVVFEEAGGVRSAKLFYTKMEGFDFEPLVETLKELKYDTTTRTGGLKTTSRVFGYQPRIAIRRDFCSKTSLAASEPSVNELIASYGRAILPLYKKAFPEVYEKHWDVVKNGMEGVKPIKDEWRIKDTPFTSGIINKNNPLKYHFDAGNVANVCSCMLAFKKDVAGGFLACPEYGIGFPIEDCSLLVFDGQSILHGVTPIKRLSEDAHRFTLVFYSLQQMWKCEPLDMELARIRNLKTQREKKRASQHVA